MNTEKNVVDLCKGQVYLAGKKPRMIENKVVLYAHHTTGDYITKSVTKQLESWEVCGWPVVVIDSSEKELNWPEYVTVISKPNIGYDFGSWAVALNALPNIETLDKVLFANNSVIGPFWSLYGLMRDFEETNADFWGPTSNTDIGWHIQSYWFGFSNGTLSRKEMKDFWKNIEVQPTTTHIVVAYEVGMSSLVLSQGWSTRVVFPYNIVGVKEGIDTGAFAWDRLLDMGFPFIKRRVLHWNAHLMLEKVREYGNDAFELAMEGLNERIITN